MFKHNFKEQKIEHIYEKTVASVFRFMMPNIFKMYSIWNYRTTGLEGSLQVNSLTTIEFILKQYFLTQVMVILAHLTNHVDVNHRILHMWNGHLQLKWSKIDNQDKINSLSYSFILSIWALKMLIWDKFSLFKLTLHVPKLQMNIARIQTYCSLWL